MNRRTFLRFSGTAAIAALAGCNDDEQEPTGTATNEDTPTPTDTPLPTPTGVDDQAPIIREYGADPRKNGTVLSVMMEGEDDRELDKARIAYGNRELTRQPDNTTVTIDHILENTAATSPKDGKITYVLTDSAGHETRKYAEIDSITPELAVVTQPTVSAGEAVLEITAEDDTGLAEVHTLLNGNTAETHDVRGELQYSDQRTVTVPEDQRFQRTPVGAQVQDWNGNTTEKEIQTYVPKYDLLEDTRLDIGAVYVSHQGGAFKQQCRDSYEGIEPAVGIYDEYVIPTEVTSQHVDQMTGHGINRLVYDYGGVRQDRDRGRRIRALLDSPLIEQVEIEPFYTKTGMLWRMDENWKKTVLPEALTYLRDTILSHENVATIEDRPVVSTWNFTYFLDEDSDAHEKLLDEFGSYEAFVDDMRSHLRVDGTDPFIIVGKGPSLVAEDTRIGDFIDLFDGMTGWFIPGPWRRGEDDSWEAIIDRVETYFENNYKYATDHDMEFTPRVFPGYDERGSGCGRQGDKYFPRSTERFQQLLHLAEQYTTRNRIDVATWNDWTEGHQIEPGTFNGTNYGTDYVEVIEKFQRGER